MLGNQNTIVVLLEAGPETSRGKGADRDCRPDMDAIHTLEFVDDDRCFISTSDDRSLRVWEYGIPVEIKTIRYTHPPSSPRCHHGKPCSEARTTASA